jgi:RecJ-like exonuclease
MTSGTCTKCDGNKTIKAFAHINNGTCFACGGTGKARVVRAEAKQQERIEMPVSTIANLAGHYAEMMESAEDCTTLLYRAARFACIVQEWAAAEPRRAEALLARCAARLAAYGIRADLDWQDVFHGIEGQRAHASRWNWRL